MVSIQGGTFSFVQCVPKTQSDNDLLLNIKFEFFELLKSANNLSDLTEPEYESKPRSGLRRRRSKISEDTLCRLTVRPPSEDPSEPLDAPAKLNIALLDSFDVLEELWQPHDAVFGAPPASVSSKTARMGTWR